MKYLVMKLGCAFGGHDWRNVTSPFGHLRRCRHCFAERA